MVRPGWHLIEAIKPFAGLFNAPNMSRRDHPVEERTFKSSSAFAAATLLPDYANRDIS
jgi:hypothetical protein